MKPLETNADAWTIEEPPYVLPEEHAAPLRVPGVHARWQHRRGPTIRMLRESGDADLVKRAERLTWCAASPHVRKRADGSPSLCLGRCRDRLCPLCSSLRGAECAARVAELVRRMNAPRFLTLTLKNSAAPLGEQLDRLFECFRRLRATPFWRTHVSGGVYSCEVTHERRGDTWHPHLHLIIDGSYMPQAAIADAWEQATGDSRIVWIEKVNDAARTAKYIAEYVNTPPDAFRWPAARFCEYAHALHGRRVLHTFGSLHGKRTPDAEPPEVEPKSVPICSVRELRERAARGCPHAEAACELMRRMGGFWSMLSTPLLPLCAASGPPIEDWERRRFVELCELAFAPAPPEPPPDAASPRPPPDATALLFDVAPECRTHHL